MSKTTAEWAIEMPDAVITEKETALSDAHETGASAPLSYEIATPALPNRRLGYRFTKRAFDILASLIGLIVLSPFFLLISIAIFIDDPHASPIFVQTRVGRGGKEFKFYKFRSMVANAENLLEGLLDQNEADGPAFKIADDPRITRIGKLIRRTCIDELPQLWNVLKGDMSLVGPRPPLPREVVYYTAYQKQRLNVKMGIVCYWQIQPDRNNCSFDQWVDLDLKYIREMSVKTDLKILFGTIGAVLKLDGK